MKFVRWTLLIVVGLVLFIAWSTDEDTFTAPRLAGPPLLAPPLLATNADAPQLLLLTTHLEIAAILPNVMSDMPRERTHIDLWAFSAVAFSPLWVRRVATVPYHARLPDPKLTGMLDGAIWLTAAGRTHAFALADGAPRPIAPEPPAATMRKPMAQRNVYEGDSSFRTRGTVIDGAWFGMARPADAPLLPRDPSRGLDSRGDYRFWTARVIETQDTFFRRVIRDFRDFAPAARSQPYEYRAAGLLTQGAAGETPPMILADPRRFLILYDLLDNDLMRRGLACLTPDGSVYWNVKLGITQIQAVAPLLSGPPAQQALIIAGVVKRPSDSDSDAAQAILRVAMADGALRVINVGDIDPRALKRGLAQ